MTEIYQRIETPDSSGFDELRSTLQEAASTTVDVHHWPARQLQACADAGVFRWFVPESLGGLGWSPRQIVEGYLQLGSACLTTTFVITQWVAAVKRLLLSDHPSLPERLMPDLISGRSHITVGISHLTTSRRHLDRPVLRATPTRDGYQLDGYSPWITGAPFADHFLIGATLGDGEQILVVVPSTAEGVVVRPSQTLVALSASRTGRVDFNEVFVPPENRVLGPAENVLKSKGTSATGGQQTSTLALALSRAAIDYVSQQSEKRAELSEKAAGLNEQWWSICNDLFQLADGNAVCSNEDLRSRANSLVLRAAQAALVAAKGAGFVEGHPVGRWNREALFFLVWSCPQVVQDANLCELAGIES